MAILRFAWNERTWFYYCSIEKERSIPTIEDERRVGSAFQWLAELGDVLSLYGEELIAGLVRIEMEPSKNHME